MFSKYLVVAFAIFVLSLISVMSCSKKGGDSNDGGDDGNTPYVILDFRAANISDSSVTLSWTATGDDADQGTATTYDIRYSKSSITPGNWDGATQVVGEPSPKAAGSAELFEVRGLDKDSTYYFALETSDEAGNRPNISTCGPAVCFENVPVSFADAHLDSVVRLSIGKQTGQLYRADLMNLVFLDANSRSITSLSGLEYCPNLSIVFLSQNTIASLTPFTNLHKIYALQLVNNNVSDISPLVNNVNLAYLLLRGNHVSNLSALAPNYRLHLLDLTDNNVSDLSTLVANLAFAETDTLYISGNPLSEQAAGTQIPALTARGVTVIN